MAKGVRFVMSCSPKAEKQVAVGIDLGGSYIKGVLVDKEGNVLGWERVSTEREKGFDHVLTRIETLVSTLSKGNKHLHGVGIGIPGMLDISRERVILAPNLEWRDVDLKADIEQRLGLPVAIDNDANAAALGEAWLGGGSDSPCFMLVTVGTGIGSGLVLDDQIFRGANGLAAELGHMTIVEDGNTCFCGRKGCLETLVSAPAILKQAQEAGVVSENSEAGEVLDLAKRGHKEAVRIVNQAMEYLAVGLKNTIVLLDLNLILIGGGIGDSAGVFIDHLRDTTISLLPVRRRVSIIRASLGNKAGALGAARLAFLENLVQLGSIE